MTQRSHHFSNKQARQIWLHLQGMSKSPCGKRKVSAFAARVEALGMVQLDSIGILSRAHHHILWSRQSAYREPDYNRLLSRDRAVFEQFSHDAAILPLSTYPYWQRQQQRRASKYRQGAWGRAMDDTNLHKTIVNLIETNGPCCSRDLSNLQTTPVDRSTNAWNRPAHKLVLDYLWLSGRLSVSHRKDFTKYYDLTERIIPEQYRNTCYSEQEQIDWLCRAALDRLGVANAGEIQRFWDACDLTEVQAWLQQAGSSVRSVTYDDHHGNAVKAYAPHWLVDTLVSGNKQSLEKHLPTPSSRLRIVNPFDPIVRDRDRLLRLFGFEYRIEIYTPSEQRKYGYYVYPMLEGSRFVGRIDVRADRHNDTLTTRAWWLEPGVMETPSRTDKILRELERLAKLAGVNHVGALPERAPLPG